MTDKILQTDETFKRILDSITCTLGGYNFNFAFKVYKETPYLQIIFSAPCTDSGEMQTQFCRKWVLQYTMSKSEVVRTAYKAAMAAFEHECQEEFRYNGVPIYSPHTDVDSLVAMRTATGYEDDIRVPEATPFHAESCISQQAHEQFREMFEAALEICVDQGDPWASMLFSALSDRNDFAYNTFLERAKGTLANRCNVDNILNVCIKYEPDYKTLYSTAGPTQEDEIFHNALKMINEEAATAMVGALVSEAEGREVFYHRD